MKKKAKAAAQPEWVSQIIALRERLHINQAELARRMECSAMTISRWERGLLQPSAEHFIQLGNLGNKNDAWFFWEMAGIQPAKMIQALDGSSRSRKATQAPSIQFPDSDRQPVHPEKSGKVVGIPLLKASAGTHGTTGDKRNSLRSIPSSEFVGVPAAWCPNPAYISLLRVSGHSMEPAIRDGDVVAISGYETERRDLYGEIVLATSEPLGLFISRLRRYDTIDVLEADDRTCSPIIVKKTGGLRIVGKVLWSISGIP
ncbi:MAG TPA: XRE family transcriptional regulator [Dongiaceae bacterium]|nr:XRE family transcriptional regulator [Dongiaceae bacterium]